MRSAYLALDPVNADGVKMWMMDFFETDKTLSLSEWKNEVHIFGMQKFFKEKHLMRHALWYGGDDLEEALGCQALVALMCEFVEVKSLAHFGKELIERPFFMGMMRNGLIMPIPQKGVSIAIDILTQRQTLWCLLYHKGKKAKSDQELRDMDDIDKCPTDTSMSLEDIIKKANSGMMKDFLK